MFPVIGILFYCKPYCFTASGMIPFQSVKDRIIIIDLVFIFFLRQFYGEIFVYLFYEAPEVL